MPTPYSKAFSINVVPDADDLLGTGLGWLVVEPSFSTRFLF